MANPGCVPFSPSGCHVTWTRQHGVKGITYCALHGAAPQLLEALEAYHTAVHSGIHADPKLYARAERLYEAAIKAAKEAA